jgi:hypothetical protein
MRTKASARDAVEFATRLFLSVLPLQCEVDELPESEKIMAEVPDWAAAVFDDVQDAEGNQWPHSERTSDFEYV